ncbi:MAG: D-alanine--D-alanine ligase family protein, partial [Acidimicrobiales bacterium]
MLNVALLLGGPSEERAISLNSARSVADHFDEREVALREIVYFDRSERPYSISRALLYSNNPGDFDFKLSQTATALGAESFAERLRRCDIAFPVMHGRFGEDGRIQQILEDVGVAYVGSSAQACRVAYDKYLAYAHLTEHGLATVPSWLFTREGAGVLERSTSAELAALVKEAGTVVFKPAAGGSSIDVVVATSLEGARTCLAELLGRHERVVAQPWVGGTEFTAVVLEGPEGPVALPPVEIEMYHRSTAHDIFSFRRKYLPTNDTRYHCPPRFDPTIVDEMRATAEAAFRALEMRDFARIDGWLDADGRILLSDVNPISGMEQNSFLFIEASEIGMTHHDALRFVLDAASRRCRLRAASKPVSSVAVDSGA